MELFSNNKEKNETLSWNKALIIVPVFLGVVIGGSLYYARSETKSELKPVEETYTVPTQSLVQNTVKTNQVNPTKNQEKQEQAVNELIMQQQIALIQEKQKALEQRLTAPLMMVNNEVDHAKENGASKQIISKDANTQFMNQVSTQAIESVSATYMGSLNSIIAQGSLIHANLESAINSDLPGEVRAIVSEAVYSADGSQILIPIGSLLIGQYKSGMLQGQSRIFIVWTRIMTPHGISIQLNSSGVDSLGAAGMGADEIDRHFWQRFGTASLLSLIGAGTANVGMNEDDNNAASSYREAIASSFAQSASESLQQDSRIPPTLKTHQGKSIMVFVSHDLHFESVANHLQTIQKIF